jgi:hypothetical protein
VIRIIRKALVAVAGAAGLLAAVSLPISAATATSRAAGDRAPTSSLPTHSYIQNRAAGDHVLLAAAVSGTVWILD